MPRAARSTPSDTVRTHLQCPPAPSASARSTAQMTAHDREARTAWVSSARRRRRPCFAYHVGQAAPGPCCACRHARGVRAATCGPCRALPRRPIARRGRGRARGRDGRGRRRASTSSARPVRRDRLEAIDGARTTSQQVGASPRGLDIDVVGFFREETIAARPCLRRARRPHAASAATSFSDKGLDVPDGGPRRPGPHPTLLRPDASDVAASEVVIAGRLT